IAKQAAVLKTRDDVGVVGCWVRQESIFGDGTITALSDDNTELRDLILKRNAFTHGEVMFRRSVFEAVGGYRPFFYYAQDRDLWVRMSRLTKHKIVPEELYFQRVFGDGVSKSIDKKITQYYLSDFAVQCGKNLDEEGRDLFDRYGEFGLFYRRRSREVAKKLVGVGLRWMMRVDLEQGRDLINQGHAEYPHLRTRLARALVLLSQHERSWRLLCKTVADLIQLRDHMRDRARKKSQAQIQTT
ncbi:MAG: hypothetical protein AAGL49_06900, partial [Pseudomonadota bacterium]